MPYQKRCGCEIHHTSKRWGKIYMYKRKYLTTRSHSRFFLLLWHPSSSQKDKLFHTTIRENKACFLRIRIACLHSSQDNILHFSPNSFMIHLPFPCDSSLPDLWPSHLEEWEAACVWLLPSSASADWRARQTKVRLTLLTFLLGGCGWGCLFPAQPPFL